MKVPVDAVDEAETVNVELAVLPDGGVMGEGSEKLMPEGAAPTQEGANITGELNPLSEFTVMVADPLPP